MNLQDEARSFSLDRLEGTRQVRRRSAFDLVWRMVVREFGGGEHLAARSGIKAATICKRLSLGYSTEVAVTAPSLRGKHAQTP